MSFPIESFVPEMIGHHGTSSIIVSVGAKAAVKPVRRPAERPVDSRLEQKLANALQLRDGWNGPGSLTPDRKTAYFAKSLVESALAPFADPVLPFFVPLSDGGLQVEWHRGELDLEVAFLFNGEIYGLFEDRESGGEFEAEGIEAINLLLRFARRVAERRVDASDEVVASPAAELAFAA